MRRQQFTILSAVSLALCLATCALWVRSCHDELTPGYRIGPGWVTAVPGLPVAGGTVASSDEIVLGDPTVDAGGDWAPQPLTLFSETGSIGLKFDMGKAGAEMNQEFAGFGTRALPVWTATAVSHYTQEIFAGYCAEIFVPHWFVALLFGLLPACWIQRTNFRRPSVRERSCARCGYDLCGLRGTPIRCPECGTVPDFKFRPKTKLGKLKITPRLTIEILPLTAFDRRKARHAARITATKLRKVRARGGAGGRQVNPRSIFAYNC